MPSDAFRNCAMLGAAYVLGAGTVARAAEPGFEAAVSSAMPAQVAAEAQEPPATQPTATTEAPASAKKKWEFATIGYVWFAGAKGETDVIKPLQPVGLDLSFGDVLKAFKFAFMGAAEARRDRVVILGDLTFIHLDARKGIDIRDRDFLDAELDSRTAEVTLLGGYRVADKGPIIVDVLAGARVNALKISLQLEGPGRSAEGSVSQFWFDPLVAARANVPLGGKFAFSLYGDIGGIGIGSDLTWQGVANIDYQINHKMNLGVGWRYFKVNYDHGDFLYDVSQSGPLITFRTVL